MKIKTVAIIHLPPFFLNSNEYHSILPYLCVRGNKNVKFLLQF